MNNNSFYPAVTLIFFTVFLFISFPCFSEDDKNDLNEYYKFPLSIGVEYMSLSPFADYGMDYNVFEIAANIRRPFAASPVFQPVFQAGMIQFNSREEIDPEHWDHFHLFGSPGLVISSRFAKTFELGGELMIGLSQAIYPDLMPELGAVGSFYLIGKAGARICLNASYNFVIDIHPQVTYLYSLTELKNFNGLIWGFGMSAHYRFGEDPDSPKAVIRSVKFTGIDIPPAFAAMQGYYVQNPIGKITVKNTEKHTISDIEVSFFQAGYMDSPTRSALIPELGPGESREVELFALFNEEIFKTEGTIPLTGDIIVTYNSKGRPAEQKYPVSYDLYDKTAISWNDDNKVASFITPADSALRNYTSFIRQACKETANTGFNKEIQTAMQIFYGLGETGCLYQADPTFPFTKVQGNTMVVDSVSLPRDTLKRITGDCDDLTVLFCSLLETVGVETGFITIPGHIYAAFNTKVPTKSYLDVHSHRNMSINVDGELWVPVEITMIGKTSFLEAWEKGIHQYKALDEMSNKRGFYITKKSQELFRPVGLRETDLGLQYGRKEVIVKKFKDELDRLLSIILNEYESKAKERGRKQDYNKLGIRAAQFQQYTNAEIAFNKALAIDKDYMAAIINIGNLFFLNEHYEKALEIFLGAAKVLEEKNMETSTIYCKICINISEAYYKIEQYSDATEYYTRAASIDKDISGKYPYLGESGTEGSRASLAGEDGMEIFFIENEDY